MIDAEQVRAAAEKFPELARFFLRYARKAAQGKRLNEKFSAGALGYDARLKLHEILKLTTDSDRDGRIRGSFRKGLREPSEWREVVRLFGLDHAAEPKQSAEDVFTRLKWKFPKWESNICRLAESEEVRRFLSDDEKCRRWAKLFAGAVSIIEEQAGSFYTLSQLGSDWFNDSKCLRAGALRRQLALIIDAFIDVQFDDDRKTFSQMGIVDNPYTSSVTLFAPIEFRLKGGEVYDFPRRMFREGLAVQLPLETVSQISALTFYGPVNEIVTSENAAPFARYVEKGIPCLYTEGYPNYAVQRMLGSLSRCGISAAHAGDVDLDGIRIAHAVHEQIGISRIIGIDLLLQAESEKSSLQLKGIPLTDEQRKRLAEFIRVHTDFPLVNVLEHLLEIGEWYEQETFTI